MILLLVKRRHLESRVPTALGGMSKDLMGKLKMVSPTAGKGFSKSSRIIPKNLKSY
jgi:hypothetical protein